MSFARKTAGAFADSLLFAIAREIYSRNERDWDLPMSRLTKAYVGGYLILRDFGAGKFPPVFENMQSAYQGEIDYHARLPGLAEIESRRRDMCKPFGPHFRTREYLSHLAMVLELLDDLATRPGARVLELGCGEGWMAECLALSGYEICATSLSIRDVAEAQKRVEALKAKNVGARLQFRVAPMESVHEELKELEPFDVVFVYESLHHAYSWESAFRSAYECLAPGGWFLICNEPNLVHTLVSYRVAKLSNTHEVGLSRKKMLRELRRIGFQRIRNLGRRIGLGIRPHWIAAQKASGAGGAGNQ
jgi:2-polyprenyl-3-methyl-5-hydroxy-6-metoxy-1,4-benzoquinol methylase